MILDARPKRSPSPYLQKALRELDAAEARAQRILNPEPYSGPERRRWRGTRKAEEPVLKRLSRGEWMQKLVADLADVRTWRDALAFIGCSVLTVGLAALVLAVFVVGWRPW